MYDPGTFIKSKTVPPRFQRIKAALLKAPIYLCPERAELITNYFKRHNDQSQPMIIQKARALRHLLENKSARIFDDELIVGNVGHYRKSAIIQPELSGVFGCQDLLWIDKRATTPLKMPWRERLRLMVQTLPYWLLRNMVLRSFYPRPHRFVRYALDQLQATYYLINEVGGIGHFLPNYERMLSQGINGYLTSLQDDQGDLACAARIACQGVLAYADNLAKEAEHRILYTATPDRAAELLEIARICRKVPRHPAETFQEALQSLWITHLAVCLEGINSAVSFGRMDQYLYPYYRRDVDAGRLTPDRARELLLCFSAKTTEHVFLLTENLSKYHGGYLVVQAAIVGGVDAEGNDAVNELSYLFLDVMEQSGLRDPNYQVRVHAATPPSFMQRAADVATKGKGVPAFFNDVAVIDSLITHGYSLEEARQYAIVGCVEQTIPGRSFLSTDAALFNLPICLELALNQGRRWNHSKRTGAATPDPATFATIDDVIQAFRQQVEFGVSRMIADLQAIEQGNRQYHPTPFSSMLVDGCLASGRDVTAGGALYNSSGIQGVGVGDTADSLAALATVVFQDQRRTMKAICRNLQTNFEHDPCLMARLRKAPKFGNDNALPDNFANQVMHIFHNALAAYTSTRGGSYVPGFYSSTSHVAFGAKTGALPSGRKAGEPFAASLGAVNGCDRNGPTALLNSVARLDASLAANGYAVNLRFDPSMLQGEKGPPRFCQVWWKVFSLRVAWSCRSTYWIHGNWKMRVRIPVNILIWLSGLRVTVLISMTSRRSSNKKLSPGHA